MQTDMIVTTAELPFAQPAFSDAFQPSTKQHPSGTIRIDNPKLQAGVHYCEFVADEFLDNYFQDDSWQLIVGVVSDAFQFHDPSRYIGSDPSSFGYVVQTGNVIGCSTLREYAHPATPGGRIGILVNFDKDEISFFRDGEDLGPAFKGFARKAEHFYFGLSVIQQLPTPAIGMPSLASAATSTPALLQAAFNCSKVHSGGEQSLSMELVNSPSLVPSHLSCNIMGGEFDLSCSSDSNSAMDFSGVDDYFQFEDCPADIQMEILGWLTVPDLKRSRLVSRTWRDLSDEDFVWGPILRSIIPSAFAIRQQTNSSFVDIYRRNTMKFADKSLGIEITNNGRTIVSSESVAFWAASHLEYPRMTTGVHYCEFKVDTFRHGSIGNTWKVVIGVVSDAFDYQLTRWVGMDEKSFGYIAQSGKKVGPSCKNQGANYGDSYKEDDVIGVLLDISSKKLKFFKNGISMGTAFVDADFNQMKGHSYHFAVSIARPGMSLTAVRYELLTGLADFENFDPKSLHAC
jgi:hypothetical protein